jgi:uncharacterized repeat protein (TIGR03803 family)
MTNSRQFMPQQVVINMRLFVVAMCVVLIPLASVRAQVTLVHSFKGSATEGYNPLGTPLLSNSTLFGMTNHGGPFDGGTLFRVATDGTGFKTLHFFNDGGVANDGRYPWYGTLVQSGENLYGMTVEGGTYTGGTIFSIGADGSSYQIVHSFSYADGQAPYGSLHHSGSLLYGMTAVSGANDFGTIFMLETNGSSFNVLHNFAGEGEGAYPHGSLIQSGSTLYGVTTGFQRGVSSGRGTIFRIETDGTGFQTLHAFEGADGAFPYGALVQSGSTLYGMTLGGGAVGRGTIFQIQTDGADFEVMHEFDEDDGLNPYGSLLLSGSTLLGTATNESGGGGAGTIFQIGTDGEGFRVRHAFNGADGAFPYGSLIQSGATLYGMTVVGGEFADGAIFSIEVPEPSALPGMGMATFAYLWRRRRDARIAAGQSERPIKNDRC